MNTQVDSLATFINSAPRVLVRAFRGRPFRAVALSDWGRALEVKGEAARSSLGFPKTDVFEFDGTLFNDLKLAYEAGDCTNVAYLWTRARPFNDALAPKVR